MRNAETVLAVIRERGKNGLPLGDVYRQLYNPDLYLCAYGRIYRNSGAMTRGTTDETVDGMSLAKVGSIIDDLRRERYRWSPARRVHIPKPGGRVRPLGIPIWKDKLLQEVMRSLLEAYYEPQLSDHSHGFRPDRGCHTALDHVQRVWKSTKWFVEGDIKGCFDNIDHEVLLAILRDHVHDNRFLRLVRGLLKAGYCEDWKRMPTYSGTPQGGVISPILANIYLGELDQFVEQTLIPEWTRGARRKKFRPYARLRERRERLLKQGRKDKARDVLKQMQRLPSSDPNDPDYRRLRYVRYADDFLLGFVGPKSEAGEIKARLATFLRDRLKLELSPEKTLITHATKGKARFLGYDIAAQAANTKHDHRGQRSVNGRIALRVPPEVIRKACARFEKNGKAVHRPELLVESDFDIVTLYQGEYRGYVEYYGLAQNLAWLGRLRWTMETSLLKTLASKHKSSVSRMARRLKTTRQTPAGPRKCLQVKIEREGKPPLVATFGGLSLARRSVANVRDRICLSRSPRRTELSTRLLAGRCEVCGSTEQVEVHHVRKLADLKLKGRREPPLWMRIMSARQRKALVLCRLCHEDVHAGRPLKRSRERA